MAWEQGDWFILDKEDEVSHVVGSSLQRGNWKQYWLKHSGRKWPAKCQIHGCGQPASVGAHVYIKFKQQNFILPTCQECNRDPKKKYPNFKKTKVNALAVWVKTHKNTLVRGMRRRSMD